MTMRTWFMARKEGATLAFNGGTVAMAVVAVFVSVVSTVASCDAATTAADSAEDSKTAAQAAVQANDLSLKALTLQGALPRLLLPAGVTDPNKADVEFYDSAETEEAIDMRGLKLINSGLADTNVVLHVHFDNHNFATSDPAQNSIWATSQCDWSPAQPIALPAQSIIGLDYTVNCPLDLTGDPVSYTDASFNASIEFGTGETITLPKRTVSIWGLASHPDIL